MISRREFKFVILLCSFLVFGQYAFSQCKVENKYFQAGEVLQYDLHIKVGISTKGGYATLSTRQVTYDGKDAYKMTLTSSSQGFARKLFKLDDTLSCIMTKELVPLAYMKDAHEAGDYTKERVGYSYPGNGTVKTRSIRHKNDNFKFDETLQFNGCTYDLLSIVFYARTLDYSTMKKGDKVSVDFVSGRKKMSMQIIHDGTEREKAGDGKKYDCIKLVLKISDDAFENSEEAMKVYITNDSNRLPIRMDSKLKIGSTKAVLNSYKGNMYPVGT